VIGNKILIIDDQPELRELLASFLTSLGYETITAENGQEGLFMLEQWPADLVTVDLQMPVLDGPGFIRIAAKRWPDLPIVIVSGVDAVDRAVDALRLGARDFITKPIESFSLVKNTIDKALESAELIRQNRDYQQNLEIMVEKRTDELEEIKRQLLYSLGKAAEYRDNETGRHVIRVGHMCGLLGATMGMEPTVAKTFQEAAPLHDIGKIGISDLILLKPGKLTQDEWNTMKRHCEIGCDILRHYSSMRQSDENLYEQVIEMANGGGDLALLEVAMVIALCHHERWDGAGYPMKLSGDNIPLVARIVAVVDVYDALGSDRPYKKPFSEEKCQEILREGRGNHFDPDIIDAFFDNLDEIIKIKKEWMD
jgi:putative two-component system response regulator